MVLAIWVYAFILVLPTILKGYGEFGYDHILGKCDYINPDSYHVHPRQLFLGIGFSVPMVVILVSYFTIWRTTRKSSSFLKLNS